MRARREPALIVLKGHQSGAGKAATIVCIIDPRACGMPDKDEVVLLVVVVVLVVVAVLDLLVLVVSAAVAVVILRGVDVVKGGGGAEDFEEELGADRVLVVAALVLLVVAVLVLLVLGALCLLIVAAVRAREGNKWLPLRARTAERVCCLLVLNLVSSTLSCIRRPRPRLSRATPHRW